MRSSSRVRIGVVVSRLIALALAIALFSKFGLHRNFEAYWTSSRDDQYSVREHAATDCDICNVCASDSSDLSRVVSDCINDDMNDIKLLFLRLVLRQPLCFAHFNDGEILAIMQTTGFTDRGMQELSPQLSSEMMAAVRTDKEGMYFGLPCALEFPKTRDDALRFAHNFKFTKIVPATLFINKNFKIAHAFLVKYLRTNRVYMVVSNTSNLTRFTSMTGIKPEKVYTIPERNAFQALEHVQSLYTEIPNGGVVVICAGPLGRILAVKWFDNQPAATVLELGSFFDLELHGRSLGATYYANDAHQACNHVNDIQVSEQQIQCLHSCMSRS